MIKTTRILMMAAVMAGLAFNSASALTVVTVSMQRLFDGYYKSAEANERLESIRAQAVEEAQAKEAELQEMMTRVREMQEELENPVLSDDARAQKQQELQEFIRQGQAKQQEFQQWQQTTMNNLQERGQEVRGGLIEEIAVVVKDVALRQYSADLVLDTSDIINSGVPTVLHAATELDITNRVLTALNEDAPNK
jgi:Skp family chaperone for outer membrane proteins